MPCYVLDAEQYFSHVARKKQLERSLAFLWNLVNKPNKRWTQISYNTFGNTCMTISTRRINRSILLLVCKTEDKIK